MYGSKNIRKIVWATGIIYLFITIPVRAMIIRHDVDPKKYFVNEVNFPAVFPVFEEAGRKECVATLIDRYWAITAAHCLLPPIEAGWVHQTANGRFAIDPFDVKIAKNQTQVVDAVFPEELNVEVRWDKQGEFKSADFDDEPSYDIALLKLATPITDVKPISLYAKEDEVGQNVTLLGWGDFGTGALGISRQMPINDGLFRQATNRIEQVDGTQIFFDFDSPESSNVLPLEGVNGPGDSGGPALVQTGTGYQIVGISSGGYYPKGIRRSSREGQYGWRECYVRVSAIRSWIERVIGTTGL